MYLYIRGNFVLDIRISRQGLCQGVTPFFAHRNRPGPQKRLYGRCSFWIGESAEEGLSGLVANVGYIEPLLGKREIGNANENRKPPLGPKR